MFATTVITRLATTIFPRTNDMVTQSWRVRLSAAGIFCAVLTASLAVGYHVAIRQTRQREVDLAKNIGLSVGNIIAAVETDGHHLARFAGQRCASIDASLTVDDRLAQYVRSAFFVKGGRIYCSTLLGDRDIPLQAYLMSPGAATRIVMHGGTPLRPQWRAMVVYERLSRQSGIGLVVPGAYVEDVLASVQAANALPAAVTGSDGSALTSDGRFVTSFSPGKDWASYVAPHAIFSLSVKDSPAWRLQDLIGVEGVALLIGLLLGWAIAAGYLMRNTPRRRLIRQVRRGLARGEFVVFYQPIVDMATGQWVGAEALVRWQHPRWGLVMPGHFIGEVERSPLIADLTQFVLRQALMELGAMDLPDGFSLTVNLAAFHAGLSGFPGDLNDILAASRTRLRVVLEITERGLLAGIDGVKDSLAALRRQGVKFAVDDFGTENSNLVLLQRFHFDYIKIDRQFVQNVDGDDYALVEAITFLAAQVGALVIAEGVEDRAQQGILKEIGVTLAQGFLFARPGSATEFATGYAASAGRAADFRPPPVTIFTPDQRGFGQPGPA
ncbi:EAL domain-containing protein [Paraburkholderia sp. FT54]|uniref:EAL domain-containing protein n=1 Tax=Paraburkholderia sp. FT54 TaxID=3074437 RepID=UPI0028774409|nr:EAL domain-containing protein [Paraburkholderia sp. FT54]WNC94545.1 EAL domain-containing protein [Paraburkholderia sp. FT54]